LADLKQKVALVEQCNSELTTKLAQSETVTTQLRNDLEIAKNDTARSKSIAQQVREALEQELKRIALEEHRAKIEELTEVNHLLQQALHALEQHFQKLRSSRSFHFMVYTARRLGLVSRTPRRCVEAMARQFSETEKALKRATGTSIAARKAKAGAVLSLQNRNRQAISQSPALPKADVVICIHNALEDVRRCLAALVRHATARLNKLILVDDGSSDTETIRYLQQFAQEARVPTLLLQNRQRTGYTMAANRGLAESKAQYVILLNSDTVVTPAWIERLIACGESDPAIGIVGPLSNAASWQSVPERFSANGDWAVNPAPSPCLDRIACAFSTLHSAKYPKVPLVNGFCLAIKRSVINTIGQFNEVLFPEGYGEENDYCLRASKAGFLLAIADDCYVFHAKSKSYSHTTRRNLAAKAQSILHQKYGSELRVATEALKNSSELEKARQAFARLLQTQPCSILFLMNLRGAGGGVTSIVQEANGLRELGASAQVAVSSQDEFYYRERFPTIPARLFYVYRNLPELIGYAGAFEFVVATLFTGVSILKMIVDQSPSVGPCYYIQDYEPNFFSASHPRYREALESYTLISNMRCFAKTRWLSETVSCKHGVKVAKVEPSLDREIFFADQRPKPGDPFVVCAMVRPTSEHRSPGLTFEILRQIKLQFGKTVQVQIFGLAQDDIFLDRQPRDFEYTVAGILNREGVARLLRASSLFIDASTYQAFGRTGLEAMACRCATILPGEGGVSEYAVEGVNTLLLARPTVEKVVQTVRRYLEEPELYQRIVDQGLQTASHYSIAKACASELRFFESIRQQLNDETSQGGVAPLTLANASPSIAFA
jgi:GT2 family glycosyltransferase